MPAPNYERPAFVKPTPKPTKLERIQAAEDDKRAAEKLKREVHALVNVRDKFRCVICGAEGKPNATTLLDRLHHCHLQDASLLGPMTTSNIFLGCSKCHLLRIHGKQIRPIGEDANAGLEFEIDEAAVVHVFGMRELPKHVHIVLPNGERKIA